ncbi:hypothetical protein GGI42DRAFT_321028 [Trichoderma sp. SZMC 28013]
MASTHKSYFLASSWDLNPSEITLGSVITDVKAPEQLLSNKDLPANIDTDIYAQEATNSSGEVEYGNEFSVGLFSTFIQLITAGFEVSHSSKSSSKLEYSYESMETRRFTPSQEFIAKVAADAAVKSRLKIWGRRAKIFLITGVKIAKGVTLATVEEAEKDTTFQVGVEIPTPQVKIGPKATLNLATRQAHTQRVEGPIIFAFQVERLRLPWKGEPTSERHVNGAVLGQKNGEIQYMIQVSDACLDDEEMKHIGLEARDITDEDGEKCRIIFPRMK